MPSFFDLCRGLLPQQCPTPDIIFQLPNPGIFLYAQPFRLCD